MSDQAALLFKIDEYKAALLQDRKSTQFVALSDAYRQLGHLDDSLEVALKGTWELPTFAAGFAAVGRVYTQRKVFAKAEEAFFSALSVDQTYIPTYKGLARVYRDQDDIQKASDILTKAIMLDPGDTSLQKMIESLSKSSDTDVTGSVVNQELAMDQTSAGMKPITTTTIAEIYIEQGLYDKALEVYRELLCANPQDISVQQKIAEIEALMSSDQSRVSAPVTDTAPSAVVTNNSGVVPAPLADGSIVIDKLNGWLEAIQARRNRV